MNQICTRPGPLGVRITDEMCQIILPKHGRVHDLEIIKVLDEDIGPKLIIY